MNLSSQYLRYSCIVVCFLFYVTQLHSQIYLQVEKYNSLKTIKFQPGDQIDFRLHAYPDTWRRGILSDILVEEQVIILDGDLFKLDDIKDIRIFKPWALGLGLRLQQFAAVWALYAVVLQIVSDDFDIGIDTVAIGAGSYGLGWLIRKIFGKKRFKLGKNSRLRIIDLRF